ncbi:DUF1152 domain-containing protein [Streptomyces sp. SP18CS02]|uniref:DUF1152 domain-containing protein n=1 Tax=Streptomyces sp. SP18CS02 TaxID=3002531 RepID=UPI002E79E478|nr:DUF1152 domain-containing protein [Streptomyces sp. SP18CS02]MEE1752452.1 DUF1152 domain-containing protein [Streptomyces sp. SP18CS02]
MTRLIVAAGGGGDAIAAAMVDAALYGGASPAVVLTYAWDRLLIDPIPGPRRPADFTGLRPLTASVQAMSAEARPAAPSGSTLPRLAAELPHTFALIDPHHGAEGITRQLEELVEHLSPESIDLLDVGGDILARGDEPTLCSPLADALVLAACCQIDAPVRLLVAGPGLDGELPADELRDHMGATVLTLTAEHVEPVGSVLDWHPSEATAMLAATARGARGVCEVRGAGLPVPLTDEGPTVHEADLGGILDRNALARAVLATKSLDEAEGHSREICGFSEIDYEREKAAWFVGRPERELAPEATLRRLARFEADARGRGITHTTFRRITEALELNGNQRQDLRALLIRSRPEQYRAPLWYIPPTPLSADDTPPPTVRHGHPRTGPAPDPLLGGAPGRSFLSPSLPPP